MKNRFSLSKITTYFVEWWAGIDPQSKFAITTLAGLTIALFCLIPFHINGYVLFGSIFGVWIYAIIISDKISTEGHKEQQIRWHDAEKGNPRQYDC